MTANAIEVLRNGKIEEHRKTEMVASLKRNTEKHREIHSGDEEHEYMRIQNQDEIGA